MSATVALVLAVATACDVAAARETASHSFPAAGPGKPGGVVEAFDPKGLPEARTRRAQRDWPKWRQGMAKWEWRHIPDTDLSSVKPKNEMPGAGGLRTRIDAWNGLAADMKTNRLYSAANGGHADYAGNEVYEIDLSADAPRWRIIRQPTPVEQIVASNYAKRAFHDYYLDGRPASTHTYYALQFISSRHAIFKFGAGSIWGTGNEGHWKIDAFSLTNNDWHPAGTWPEVVPNSRKSVIGAPVCKDPDSELVYIAAPGNIRRFSPESGEVTVLARWPDDSSAVYARACAVDPVRNRVVFFGDAYRTPDGGLMYGAATKSLSRIKFKGDLAADITKRSYNYAWFDPKTGGFLLKTGKAGRVYSIDPESFAVELIDTKGESKVPDAANGVHTRWQQLPKLGGYAYYPRGGSGIWFLATETAGPQ